MGDWQRVEDHICESPLHQEWHSNWGHDVIIFLWFFPTEFRRGLVETPARRGLVEGSQRIDPWHPTTIWGSERWTILWCKLRKQASLDEFIKIVLGCSCPHRRSWP